MFRIEVERLGGGTPMMHYYIVREPDLEAANLKLAKVVAAPGVTLRSCTKMDSAMLDVLDIHGTEPVLYDTVS